MKPLPSVRVGKRRSSLLKGGHLWVFKGDIHEGDLPDEPCLVAVKDGAGNSLGKGYYNPLSNIAVRILSFKDEPLDEAFFEGRIRRALHVRKVVYPSLSTFRVVFSESDGLPGLIVDRYGDVVVCQILTLGMQRMWTTVKKAVLKVLRPSKIVVREDSPTRSLEGLPVKAHNQSLYVVAEEMDIRYRVDVKKGHKTGLYLDQKDNRFYLRGISRGKRVLDLFSYVGGWTLNALKGGADEVWSIDTSSAALELLKENAKLNGLDTSRLKTVKADAFNLLKRIFKDGERFDIVVSDPPAFAKKQHDVKSALRGYKYINLYALKLLKKGGVLFTFSCSQHISPGMLLGTVMSASKDAGLDVRILKVFRQSMDHPVHPAMPETSYLKGYMVVVL